MAKNKKKFTVKEFIPTKGELDYKTSTYNTTYFERPQYAVIDGEPFIWTEKDHQDVLAAYQGRKIVKRVTDYIDDGGNKSDELLDDYIAMCLKNRND